jgi:hypothetical protein
MTSQPGRRRSPERGPVGPPQHTPGPAPPDDDSTAAVPRRSGCNPQGWRLAYSVEEAARLTGLSRALLYEEMRCGDLASGKIRRRHLIDCQHPDQFPGIAS